MDRLARIILRLKGKFDAGSLIRYEDGRVEISGETSTIAVKVGEICNIELRFPGVEVAEKLPAGPYYDERARTILFVRDTDGETRIQHFYEAAGEEIMEHLLRLVPLEALADVDGK